MTTTEFLSELEGVCQQFDWALTADTGGHAERRATRRFHIQGTSRGDSSISLEPLRALCYARTGIVFGPDAWSDAAGLLGLDRSDAEAVMAASNDRTWRGPEGRRVPEERLLSLRRRLLVALGLFQPAKREAGTDDE